jgi:hypothetical protein
MVFMIFHLRASNSTSSYTTPDALESLIVSTEIN